MEFTLLWAALTGVFFAWVGTRMWKEGLPDRAADRMIGAAAVGLLIGRLTAMVVQGINPLTNPLDILIVRGGVHTGAAAIGAVVAFAWAVDWRFPFLDATAPAAVLGLAGWHAGCVWRGACLGAPSNLFWTWAEPGSLINRHPVELYTAIGLAIAAWLISRLPWRLLTRTGSAIALAGLFRLVTEPWRLSITGGPIWWYVAAIAVGLLLIWQGPRLGRTDRSS